DPLPPAPTVAKRVELSPLPPSPVVANPVKVAPVAVVPAIQPNPTAPAVVASSPYNAKPPDAGIAKAPVDHKSAATPDAAASGSPYATRPAPAPATNVEAKPAPAPAAMAWVAKPAEVKAVTPEVTP